MGWSASMFTVVVFGSAAVAIVVAIGTLRKRPDPMAWPLAVLMFTTAAWAIPHAVSLGFTSVEQVAFWHRLRYPGTVVAPVAYLVVALKYAGHDRWLSTRVYTLLAIIPVATIAVVWTNQFHGLFWDSLAIASVNGASVFVPEFGPWYWLNLGYLYLLTLVSLVVLGNTVVRSGPIYRKQAVLMFIGGAAPLTANLIANFGVGPEPTVDFTTTVLALSGLTFALALFHFDLLEIRPVARDLLVEELDDGVVVVGPDERIRDFNRTAARILEGIEMDKPATETLPSDVATDGGELVVEIDGQERLFHTRSTTITDKLGRETGRMVYLNDITDIVKREQRISVLNRILRHNVRNELNVVTGRLEFLAEQVSPDNREHIETASRCTQRVIELSNKARNIERTLQTSETSVIVSASAVAERVIQDTQKKYPDAHIERDISVEPSEGMLVRVVDEELFELALTELVENAILHNDTESPSVTIGIESANDWVHVSVTDNGPVIPKEQTTVLNSRTETDLDHGSGLGLWLVKWTTSLSSGSLSFAENEPRGNVVTFTIPLVEE